MDPENLRPCLPLGLRPHLIHRYLEFYVSREKPERQLTPLKKRHISRLVVKAGAAACNQSLQHAFVSRIRWGTDPRDVLLFPRAARPDIDKQSCRLLAV